MGTSGGVDYGNKWRCRLGEHVEVWTMETSGGVD